MERFKEVKVLKTKSRFSIEVEGNKTLELVKGARRSLQTLDCRRTCVLPCIHIICSENVKQGLQRPCLNRSHTLLMMSLASVSLPQALAFSQLEVEIPPRTPVSKSYFNKMPRRFLGLLEVRS